MSCIRSATWANLRLLDTGLSFLRVNTHLDHVSEPVRVEGSRLILRNTSEIQKGATEDIPTPTGKRRWSRTLIRNIVKNDVYGPHTLEELEELMAPEVVARLNPEKCFGA